MGYRGGELTSLVGPLERGVRRVGRRGTEKVGDDLLRRVRRHTPTARPGAPEVLASYGSSEAWIRARGGRRPGTLKNSWHTSPVESRLGSIGVLRYTVAVLTHDPVAPHVEYPTVPHLIRAKVRPRTGRRGALTIPTPLGMVLRREVHHPGTQGSFMLAKALAEVAVAWQVTVKREWDEEARMIWRVRS